MAVHLCNSLLSSDSYYLHGAMRLEFLEPQTLSQTWEDKISQQIQRMSDHILPDLELILEPKDNNHNPS